MSSLHDSLKHIEVGREGLAGAARVIDGDGHVSTGCQAEGHRHAVIVICVHRYSRLDLVSFGWCDHAVVPTLFHLGAQLPALGDDGHHALRLLHPPVVHVANGGGPVREHRRHRQRHGGVRDVVTVMGYPHQLALHGPCDGDGVRFPRDVGAHEAHHLCKAHVSLQAVGAAPLYSDGATSDGGARQEVRRGRGVPLHIGGPRRLVRLPGRDAHVLQPIQPLHLDSEALHKADGHVHIWLRHQLVHDFDLHALGAGCQGRRHQQRRQVLAADTAADAHLA
mmetsp:Transcript_18717/g.56631  ORF Transcript_18717/g.56631 Transcript_18717/m.56631 type:complete len:279 (+) Transcript_18717:1021-1857(+)